MNLAGRQAVSLKHTTLSVFAATLADEVGGSPGGITETLFLFAATLADEVGGSPGGITVKNTFCTCCSMFVVKYFTHRV